MRAGADMRIEHHYATLPNGITLHYAACGAGPLLLFVHGFPEFWYEWKDQLLELGNDHRAVAVDMRGYNLSSKPAEVSAYKAKQLIEDLRLFLEHLGAQRCVMVAHDWGGAIAWSFAIAHPERLDKLVIINAPHPAIFSRELRHDPAQQAASAYMNFFRNDKAERVLSENGYARLVRMTLDAWQARGGGASEEDRRAYIDAWSQPGALTGALNWYRASPLHPPQADGSDLPPQLEAGAFQVVVPTLVIWGDRDEALLIGNLDGLEDVVADLQVVRIPDASHWVVHEKPAEVAALIRKFASGAQRS
jgi:pimeloyl-ACP methyl ester carboxylesterase